MSRSVVFEEVINNPDLPLGCTQMLGSSYFATQEAHSYPVRATNPQLHIHDMHH